MTFSILAIDQKTGTLGAAAATGSLCVGGWVLRGQLDAGLVASQGTAPSTFWRDEALAAMGTGMSAEKALLSVTKDDAGQDHRQLATLDRRGLTASHTGAKSVAWAGARSGEGFICTGNMLTGPRVLDALAGRFEPVAATMADRLLGGLRAAEAEGGDSRGLLSAAMLVLTPDAPPLDLRVDHSATPLSDLAALLARVRTRPYADWLHEVPVQNDRARTGRTSGSGAAE
ncbi:MAG: DUF1028 domain-containing protein [Pseudomonadota bacterium]